MSTSQPRGPPYAPHVATLGGRPTPVPDVVLCSILIVFYAGSAAGNMSIFQLNRRKHHKFLISGALYGFSMARLLTCSLRIGVAYVPNNISLSIAPQILLNVGILIVYIVNLIFAQRILRARQPAIGWHPALRTLFKILYGGVGIALVLVITFIVIQFYTLHSSLLEACRHVQLAAGTYLLFVAVMPLIILAVTWSMKKAPQAQKIGVKSSLGGVDSWTTRQKSIILLISACLCVLSSGFKTGANLMPPRPADNPAWYQSKAALYVSTFLVEILILYMFLLVRIDHRFHVPDGSSKRKSFAAVIGQTSEDEEKEAQGQMTSRSSSETEKEEV